MAGADSVRLCRHCGTGFIRQGKEAPTLYCCEACRRAGYLARAKRHRDKVRGAPARKWERRPPPKPKDQKPRVIEKPCGWCGAAMRLKPGIAKEQRFCSKTCGLKARAVREGKCGPRPVACLGCGITTPRRVRREKDRAEYCSRACYERRVQRIVQERDALKKIASNWAYKPSRLIELEIAALRRIAKRPIVHRLTYRPCSNGCGTILYGYMEYGRTCAVCARSIRRRNAKRARQTEAGKARRRAEKARRRAIERGIEADIIDPIKVFERDKWRCHLCGCKAPKRLRGTYEPDAPELDHVVPLAAGGTHTWGNVKCACRRCNGAKSDRPMGQLGFGLCVS